jgi:hypothetical protein
MVAVGVLPAVIFFMERGETGMSVDEFIEIWLLDNESIEVWLLVALVVLFIQLVTIYLMIKTGEKIHEKRMKEIKEKEQV